MNTAADPELAPQSALLMNSSLAATNGQAPFRAHTQDDQFVNYHDVMCLFEKKFNYQKSPEWSLPPAKEVFREYYQFDTLQQLKQTLNSVKCKLNDYSLEEWSAHTRRRNPSSEIPWKLKHDTKAEFVTVAWCKFYECLKKFPVVQCAQLNSLHLCEAPGAFIAALNHYLQSTFADRKEDIKWQWLSTTLNPYYEGNPLNQMIIDDRFMLNTLNHWLFHSDFSGNIISRENIDNMRQECKRRLGEVHLISADGSIDCVKVPDCQEEFVAPLHFAEVTAALSILAEGGSFVMKFFTLFDTVSVSKLYLLNCAFDEVHVFKPATSKKGNSEVYIICLGYRPQTPHLQEILELMKQNLLMYKGGRTLPIFSKKHFPRDFLLKHEICSRFFMNLQIQAIESNIYAFEFKDKRDARRNHILRSQVCQEYYRRYNIHPIAKECKVLRDCGGEISSHQMTTIYKDSHTQREMSKDLSREEQIFKLRSSANELEKLLQPRRYGTLLTLESPSVSRGTLTIYRGQPYEFLNSSMYVMVHSLLLRLKFLEVFESDPIYKAEPRAVLESGHCLRFPIPKPNESFMQCQRDFFTDLLGHLLEHKPLKLGFEDFLFLNHYCVSILYYLSKHVFNKLSINTEPKFEVVLEKFEPYTDELVEELKSLRDLLLADSQILCVLDIKLLHRNDFDNALTEFNNLLLIENFKKSLG